MSRSSLLGLRASPKRIPILRRTILCLLGMSLIPAWMALRFVGLIGWQDRLQLGADTTVLDGPLRADGTVDYAKAIDDEYCRGVTPETNAAVLLLEALGPQVIPTDIAIEYFQRIGVNPSSMSAKHLQMQSKRPAKP